MRGSRGPSRCARSAWCARRTRCTWCHKCARAPAPPACRVTSLLSSRTPRPAPRVGRSSRPTSSTSELQGPARGGPPGQVDSRSSECSTAGMTGLEPQRLGRDRTRPAHRWRAEGPAQLRRGRLTAALWRVHATARIGLQPAPPGRYRSRPDQRVRAEGPGAHPASVIASPPGRAEVGAKGTDC